MAIRALQTCPRQYLRAGRALYSTEQRLPVSGSGSEVKPALFDYPVPTLSEYRFGVPPQTGVKNTTRATKVTTLPNGMRVASLSSNDMGRSVGLFVNSGTKDEGRSQRGINHILKFAAYGSSVNKPGYQVVREFEAAGATLNATVGREHLLFSSEFPAYNSEFVIPLISDLLHPKLSYNEVVDQKASVKLDTERLEADPVANIIDLLHKQAYRNKGVGQSTTANANDIHHVARGTVFNWVHDHYVPSKAVIVGVGFEHEELVKSVEAAYANQPHHEKPKDLEKENHHDEHHSETAQSSKPSKYAGGETLIAASGHTHLAIAYEGASLKGDTKHRIALGVLQHVLGSVLVNNPGSHAGLTSRLATNLLPSLKTSHVLSAFNFSYSETGLFGVYAEAHGEIGTLVSGIASELQKARSNLSAEEFAKGKAAYKFAFLEEASKRTPAMEFIGSQILTSGKAMTPEEFAAQIDSITADDVAAAAKKALATNPTVVVVGDVSNIPSHQELTPNSGVHL